MSAWSTVDAMAIQAGVTPDRVRGQSRITRLVVLRRVIARHLSHAGYTSTEIAVAMCRDHTSILHLLGRTAASKRRKGDLSRVTDSLKALRELQS